MSEVLKVLLSLKAFEKLVDKYWTLQFENWKWREAKLLIFSAELQREGKALAWQPHPDSQKSFSEVNAAVVRRNAESLFKFFISLDPEALASRQRKGKRLLQAQELAIDLSADMLRDWQADLRFDGDLRHQLWLDTRKQMKEEGTIPKDAIHPGDLPFIKLPEEEILKLDWQALADWRFLALLEEQDFKILSSFSTLRDASSD